tara:strand:+ start:688 stop:879 length:192 start_codon:yes stop_codon:yes gene_type:complete
MYFHGALLTAKHFINAVVERDASRLEPVAVLRLAAGEYMKNTPPFIDFPPALTKSTHVDHHLA